MSRVFLIDASIYIFKYYFSLPDVWHSQEGYSTFAVRGYASWLAKLLNNEQPAHAAACFDESLESCFRNDIYPEYKSSRVMPDEELAFQLEACKQITELMGVSAYASEKYEADDLFGALAKRCDKKKFEYAVLSRDKDLGQLITSEKALLWDYPDASPLTSKNIAEKFGVPAYCIADFLALTGDASDDIPGVPGIGPKKAAQVITALGSWKTIRKNIHQVAELNIRGAKGIANSLSDYAEQVDMALQLTTIATDAELGRRFQIKTKKPDVVALEYYSKYLGLNLNFQKIFGENP